MASRVFGGGAYPLCQALCLESSANGCFLSNMKQPDLHNCDSRKILVLLTLFFVPKPLSGDRNSWHSVSTNWRREVSYFSGVRQWLFGTFLSQETYDSQSHTPDRVWILGFCLFQVVTWDRFWTARRLALLSVKWEWGKTWLLQRCGFYCIIPLPRALSPIPILGSSPWLWPLWSLACTMDFSEILS